MKSHPSLLELAADVFRSKKKQRDRKDGGGSRTSAPSPPPPLHHVSFERSAEAGRSFMFRRRGERSSCKQNNKEDHLIGDNGAKTRMMWDGRERWPSTSSLPPIVAMQQQQNPTSMTTSMMLLISRKHSAQHSGKSVKGLIKTRKTHYNYPSPSSTMIPASMSMSLYNTPSSASAAEGGSSSSSSGYSGTPSTLSLEDSGTELCRSDSTCTLVSTPSWARKEDHGDGNYDRIFCIEASNNRDSGCEVAESPSQKHESISSIMIGTVERKREREQRKQAERGAKRYRDRNVLHAEGDNQAYLLSLLTPKKIVVVKQQPTFYSTVNSYYVPTY